MMFLDRIRIGLNEAEQRLDRFLRKYLTDMPLSDIYRLIRTGEIRVNGRREKENYRVRVGDAVELRFEHQKDDHGRIKSAGRNFSIIYEDENILLADKPRGMIVHPDSRHIDNTLADQVLYYLYSSRSYDPRRETTFRPAAVNRLDVNTGGIVMFAKNYGALQSLSLMVRDRLVGKYYICVVKGEITADGDVRSYLRKDTFKNRAEVFGSMVEGGREIHTRFHPIKSLNGYTLLEVGLLTGRSHQIRAQLAKLGCPIIGDGKYGDPDENEYQRKLFNLSGQLLYAYKVTFDDTAGNLGYLKGRSFYGRVPDDYRRIIERLVEYTVR